MAAFQPPGWCPSSMHALLRAVIRPGGHSHITFTISAPILPLRRVISQVMRPEMIMRVMHHVPGYSSGTSSIYRQRFPSSRRQQQEPHIPHSIRHTHTHCLCPSRLGGMSFPLQESLFHECGLCLAILEYTVPPSSGVIPYNSGFLAGYRFGCRSYMCPSSDPRRTMAAAPHPLTCSSCRCCRYSSPIDPTATRAMAPHEVQHTEHIQ